MSRSRPCERRACEHCGADFDAPTNNIRKGWGRLCSRACVYAWIKTRPRTAKPITKRELALGEVVPSGEPKRYRTSSGYIRLRWRVAPCKYVETYEHRLVAGVVTADHVHHKNGNKSDNRPENLEVLSATDHLRRHNPISWDVDEAARLYHQECYSLGDLARLFQLSHNSVVLRAFQRRGIPRRPRSGFART